MPKIYTKKGDRGMTGLFGGERVSKDCLRVEAYGEIDALNSVLGVVRSSSIDPRMERLIAEIQRRLFDLGAELATRVKAVPAPEDSTDLSAERNKFWITERDTEFLERNIDDLDKTLPTLQRFILPGGSQSAALLHVARTTCRTAERRVVTLAAEEPLRPEVVRYLNRLSDLLFVLARYANAQSNVADLEWSARTSQ